MFNSQKINTDPQPWLCECGGSRSDMPENPYGLIGHDYLLAPRPEFDNKPNPILVEFRNLTNRDAASVLRQLPSFYTPHIDHARKVLQRLANLTTTTATEGNPS